ncbi:zinc-ribbon domain-containing protein [Cypionkella sp.]|uniref:zinc-ribbon domain-containing protein n=1 Tax=Cypionkella sp. TaxID=2811411 RepID=UPI003750455E
MRLVCPNCDAEYEVEASVIPEGGRDVQCSNCGHAWFQTSPEFEADLAAEAALHEPPPPVTRSFADRQIDESVLAVLKEEAEREVEARRAEAPRIEIQTDMALEAPTTEAAGLGAVARRLAHLKGIDPVVGETPLTRADAFPEIETINSSLRSSTEKRVGEADGVEAATKPESSGSGFRSGFALMLLLAVVLVAVYVMAPQIAQQIPAADAALTTFVQTVDAARIEWDRLLQSAIAYLNGLMSGTA